MMGWRRTCVVFRRCGEPVGSRIRIPGHRFVSGGPTVQHQETPDAGDEPTPPAPTAGTGTGLGGLTWTRWSLATDEQDDTDDTAGLDEDTSELPLLSADDPTPVTAVP